MPRGASRLPLQGDEEENSYFPLPCSGEPNDPRELSRPQVDPRRANQMYGKKIRNTIGQIGFMAGGIGLIAAIFDGRPPRRE